MSYLREKPSRSFHLFTTPKQPKSSSLFSFRSWRPTLTSDDSFTFEGGDDQVDTYKEGFDFFPKKQRVLKLKEADHVRTMLVLLMMGHILFMAVDLLIFASVWNLLWEVLYAYVAYYSYVTLSPISIYGYIALLIWGALSGITNIKFAF